MLNQFRKTVLISYRRADTGAVAGHLAEKLKSRFGQARVFIDVDNIPYGVDFRDHIKGVIEKCDVVLVLLGRQWAGQGAGTVRIQDPADYFRIEIETALGSGRHIIPVVVDRAEMPTAGELPTSLERFAFLNAAPLAVGRDFGVHCERIASAIVQSRSKQPLPSSRSLLFTAFAKAIAEWAMSCAIMIASFYVLLFINPSFIRSASIPALVFYYSLFGGMCVAIYAKLLSLYFRVDAAPWIIVTVNGVPGALLLASVLTRNDYSQITSLLQLAGLSMAGYFTFRIPSLYLFLTRPKSRNRTTFRTSAVEVDNPAG